MRAVLISRFGGPEVLEAKEVDRPEPGPGELLVKILYSGVNPVDYKIRQHGTWTGTPLPAVLGYDASGVVEKAGAGVKDFKPGDEVFFTPEVFNNPHGTYAEYTVVRESIVAPKPASLGHEQAAAVPLAAGTAWEAVVRRLKPEPGETVLIHGGAGGVGSFAVQIAKAAGARVIATAGAKNQSLLKELGADVAVDYAKDDLAAVVEAETGKAGVDAVFDTVGGPLIAQSLPLVRPFGRLACVLPPEGGDMRLLYVKNLTLHGVLLTREGRRLREITRLIDRGRLKPVIDQVLPLAEVRKAHERLQTGHGRGKIVLKI
jgi:NADPH:quinone reductase